MRLFVLQSALIGALVFSSSSAWAIYRCDSDGQTSYSDVPCAGAKKLDIHDTIGDDRLAGSKQVARERRIVRQAENEQRKQEAAEQKAQQRSAKKQIAQAKKCDALERRQRWAQQDASSATGKAAEKVRRKASRASEQYQAECGSRRTQLLQG